MRWDDSDADDPIDVTFPLNNDDDDDEDAEAEQEVEIPVAEAAPALDPDASARRRLLSSLRSSLRRSARHIRP